MNFIQVPVSGLTKLSVLYRYLYQVSPNYQFYTGTCIRSYQIISFIQVPVLGLTNYRFYTGICIRSYQIISFIQVSVLGLTKLSVLYRYLYQVLPNY